MHNLFEGGTPEVDIQPVGEGIRVAGEGIRVVGEDIRLVGEGILDHNQEELYKRE